MNTAPLADKIANLVERVRLSAQKSQYGKSDILLLPVSKTRPVEDIRAAHGCGLVEFGESYLREALQKMAELEDLELVWHFIGPIQSNKTRPIAEHFDWVHSLDRGKIARRLSEQRPPGMSPLQVCVQVNISGESSKSGAAVEDVPQLLRDIMTLPHLQLRGLMAIPAPTDDIDLQRQAFARLRTLQQQLLAIAPDMDTLSMGMSGDFEAAIAEGSTIVRLGTAIFGPRKR
jgi:pyridoxal phosphate enzyme (YggS family)